MKDFPYKTSFSSVLKPLVSSDKDKLLAVASLLEIGKFIPDIDTTKNFDVLPIAFNACVINRVNKNGDVIDTPTAIATYKSFINKPINVEHNRQKVIGVILTAGFSAFGTDESLTEEQASAMKEPFNITLGGLIWRVVSPELAEFIEESNDPTSAKYLGVSASWELGFTDYNLAILDGGQKNLSQAQIISDPEQVKLLKDKLKSLGGDGKENGKFIYRVPKDIIPLGIGLTEKPAAEVQGVAIKDSDLISALSRIDKAAKEATERLAKMLEETCATQHFIEKCSCGTIISQCRCPSDNKKVTILTEACEKCNKKENKISQSSDLNVKIERKVNMKITSVKDITDESLKQIAASEIAEFVAAELKKGSDSWEQEKGKLNKTITDVQAESAKAKEDSETLKKELEKVKAALAELNVEKENREKVEKFNSRMSVINEEFELDDEVRAALVEEVKLLASDEDFDKFKKKAAVLLKGFAKKAKAGYDDSKMCAKHKQKGCAECKTAGAAQIVDDAVDNADKEKGGLPNGAPANAKSLKEIAQSAFAKENFTVKY